MACFRRSACKATYFSVALIFQQTTFFNRWWYFKGSVHDIGHVKLTLRVFTRPIHRITSSFLILAATCALADTTLGRRWKKYGEVQSQKEHRKITLQRSTLWVFETGVFWQSNSGKILWYLSISAASSMAAECGSEAVYMTIIMAHCSLDFEYPYNELPHLHKGSWVKPILNVIGDWDSQSCSKTLVQ